MTKLDALKQNSKYQIFFGACDVINKKPEKHLIKFVSEVYPNNCFITEESIYINNSGGKRRIEFPIWFASDIVNLVGCCDTLKEACEFCENYVP